MHLTIYKTLYMRYFEHNFLFVVYYIQLFCLLSLIHVSTYYYSINDNLIGQYFLLFLMEIFKILILIIELSKNK